MVSGVYRNLVYQKITLQITWGQGEKGQLGPCLTPFIKINARWIEILSIKTKQNCKKKNQEEMEIRVNRKSSQKIQTDS